MSCPHDWVIRPSLDETESVLPFFFWREECYTFSRQRRQERKRRGGAWSESRDTKIPVARHALLCSKIKEFLKETKKKTFAFSFSSHCSSLFFTVPFELVLCYLQFVFYSVFFTFYYCRVSSSGHLGLKWHMAFELGCHLAWDCSQALSWPYFCLHRSK